MYEVAEQNGGRGIRRPGGPLLLRCLNLAPSGLQPARLASRPAGWPQSGPKQAQIQHLLKSCKISLKKVYYEECILGRHKVGCDIFYGENGEHIYTDVVFGQ